MLKTNFDPFPELETKRLVLRRMKSSDAHDLYQLRSDKVVMEYQERPIARSIDEMSERIANLDAEIYQGKSIEWAVSTYDNPRLIGTIGIWKIIKKHHRGEVGYMLFPDYYNKGLMTEALAAVIDYGFNNICLHSLEGQVTPENIGSIKVLERNGFVREAYYKENYLFEGDFIDTAVYSLLKSKSKQ